MKKTRKLLVCLGVLLGSVMLLVFGVVIGNQFSGKYENLNEADQFVLGELAEYCKKTKTDDIWMNFALGNKPIVAMKDSFGAAYLINPEKEIHSIFVKKIEMPSELPLNVYRISSVAPQLFQFRLDGNFNTTEKVYRLYGNDVFYTKYNEEEGINKPFASTHYITFLTHEAFHYYMQQPWADGSTYSTDQMSQTDMELLYKEYDVLTKIQTAVVENVTDKNIFLEYAKEYVKIASERLEENPEYMKEEMERETTEGTATYVGIKASKLVGYDFGVMYFDNIKDVPLSDLKVTVESGSYDKRQLADRIPYETGALLCILMDKIEIPDWQERLNAQTKENQITLYSIIQEFVQV